MKIKIKRRYEPDESWPCSNCGKKHEFCVYVAVHWGQILTHTCNCGQRHRIQRGVVTPVKEIAKIANRINCRINRLYPAMPSE